MVRVTIKEISFIGGRGHITTFFSNYPVYSSFSEQYNGDGGEAKGCCDNDQDAVDVGTRDAAGIFVGRREG